ncbi:MAG: hypothetical protein AB1756_01530 [Acidobacteriota bacterium]
MARYLRMAAAPLFLVITTILFFNSAILSDGQFYYGDISQNHHPARKLIATLIAEGVFPLWNPFITSGQPLYANPNNLLFHPISLIFLIIPFEAAFKYSIIIQYLLCAFGMHLFSRECGLSRQGSLLAASLFSFSGFMLCLAHHYNLLCSAAWIPLFLFFLHRFLYRSRLYLLPASLILSVVLITAEPFFILSTLLIALAVIFLQKPDPTQARAVLSKVGLLTATLFCALLFSLFLLLPAAEFFANSERAAGLASDIISKWSLHPEEIIGLFIPRLFGNPFVTNPAEYWGSFFFRETVPFFASLYTGLPSLFLVSILLYRRDRTFTIFAILIVASLFLGALGSVPLFQKLSGEVPLLSAFRYTSKFFILFSFSWAILSGSGLDLMREISEKRLTQAVRRWPFLVIPVLITLSLVALYCIGRFFPQSYRFFIERVLHVGQDAGAIILSSIASRLLASVVYAAGISLVVALLILASFYTKIRGSLACPVLIGIILMDLLIVNMNLNPVAGANFYKMRSPFLGALGEDREIYRVFRDRTPGDLMLKIGSRQREEGFYWNRMMLLQWIGLPHRIAFAFDRNVDRLGPYDHYLLMEKAKDRGWSTWKKILDMSGVRYLLLYNKVNDPHLSEVMERSSGSNYPVVLYLNRAPLPRVYAVPRVRMIHDPNLVFRELFSETFHPYEEAVVLAGTHDGEMLNHLKAGDGPSPLMRVKEQKFVWMAGPDRVLHSDLFRIKILKMGCNEIRLAIESNRDGFLVLSDSYYSGWRCRVDGKESRIFLANGLYRGICFERGTHIVEFLFSPTILFIGLALSAVSITGIASLTLFFSLRIYFRAEES